MGSKDTGHAAWRLPLQKAQRDLVGSDASQLYYMILYNGLTVPTPTIPYTDPGFLKS